MKKIVLAPDSFKGTLSAAEICRIEECVIRRYIPDVEVHAIPMSDGGEGMTDSYLSLFGGEKIFVTVTGADSRPVNTYYAILPDGTAVMEMASAAGLPQMGNRKDPLHATTRGVGEMILDAASRGVRNLLMGLGGSATNDCGIGMAASLGFRFLDKHGDEVAPLAIHLSEIEQIIEPKSLPNLRITAACDVDNPLVGRDGATYTFGPQKGADTELLALLECGMGSFARVLEEHYSFPVANAAGAGAAGGLGAAVMTLLHGTLKSGIETLLDAANFDTLLDGTDLVLTGEGRIDWQSARGKVPMGVGLRCKRAGVPCIALCGSIGERAEAVYDFGITAIFSAVKGVCTFDEVCAHSVEDLEFLTDSTLRSLLAVQRV